MFPFWPLRLSVEFGPLNCPLGFLLTIVGTMTIMIQDWFENEGGVLFQYYSGTQLIDVHVA